MDDNKNTELNGFDSVSNGAEKTEHSYTTDKGNYGYIQGGAYGGDGKYPKTEPAKPAKSRSGAAAIAVSIVLSLILGSGAGFGSAYLFLKQNTPAPNPGNTVSIP
ncbi:MAG: hypothetical protein IIW23_04690, partial [Clostridia bacterium]|nr:hypothetical protein [Clostridia bacterium]